MIPTATWEMFRKFSGYKYPNNPVIASYDLFLIWEYSSNFQGICIDYENSVVMSG